MKSNWKNYKPKNGHTPQTNKMAGSLTYTFVHALIFIFAYKIWGFQMLGQPWFYIMHLVAFFSVKPILRDLVGFWTY